MSELGADFSLGFNSRRPMDHDAIRGSTIMGCDLLGPLERCVARPGPANRIMRKRIWASPVIDMTLHLGSSANNAVQRHHFVVGSLGAAFGAGSIIAHNVNEQCVVQYADFLKGINQSSYLFISMLGKTGERLHLPRLEFFLIRCLAIPRGNVLWSLGQLRARRN